jgi:hypothetical protein
MIIEQGQREIRSPATVLIRLKSTVTDVEDYSHLSGFYLKFVEKSRNNQKVLKFGSR